LYPLPTKRLSEAERKLLALFARLGADDQRTLCVFAEFLASRGAEASAEPQPLPEPADIPRPASETVIGAVRRLSQTYYMLNRGAMLQETTALVSEHLLQGRPAQAVIDELEALFRNHFVRDRSQHIPHSGS
jgi:hypothetical protein